MNSEMRIYVKLRNLKIVKDFTHDIFSYMLDSKTSQNILSLDVRDSMDAHLDIFVLLLSGVGVTALKSGYG